MVALRETNRTQRLVLGFLVLALFAFVAILIAAPEIYDSTLNLWPGHHLLPELAFLIVISVFIALLGVGVLRRWRWMFWLVLVAFLAGIIRVFASALQLMNVLPGGAPHWYVALQAAIGVIQFLIAVAMVAGYRKGGTWGAF